MEACLCCLKLCLGHERTSRKGKSIFDLIRLQDGEIYVDDIVGLVEFKTYYRPDNYPCWIPWHSWSVCSQQPSTAIPNAQPTYRTRMGLGTPDPSVCEPANGRTMVEGYTFQFKVTITGHCRFRGMKVRATMAPQTRFAQMICKDTCEELPAATDCQPCGLIDCINPDDFSVYTIQNNLVPVQPVPPPFYNETVYFPYPCDQGQTLQYTGTLPGWITLDTVNSQIVGAAGQYQGINQADANLIAQAALDQFANISITAGTLTCASASDICTTGVASLTANVYAIQGYVDGMITNDGGPFNCSGVWDGSFPFTNSTDTWFGGQNLSGPNPCVNGGNACIIRLGFGGCWNGNDNSGPPQWEVYLQNGNGPMWSGTMTGGQTPVGVYTQSGGSSAGPPTLTIVQIPGTTSPGNMSCGS